MRNQLSSTSTGEEERNVEVELLTGPATVAPVLDATPPGSQQPRSSNSAQPSSCNPLQPRSSLPGLMLFSLERSDSPRRALTNGSSLRSKCMSRSSSRQRPACNGFVARSASIHLPGTWYTVYLANSSCCINHWAFKRRWRVRHAPAGTCMTVQAPTLSL